MGKRKPKFDVERFVRLSNWKHLVFTSVIKRYPDLARCCRIELQPNKRLSIMHVVPSGFLRTSGISKKEPAKILEFMARFQQEVFRLGIKPPGGAEMIYWGSWLYPRTVSASIRLPYAMWGTQPPESAKIKAVSFGNIRTRILYWNEDDRAVLENLLEKIKNYGHLAQNSIHETIASIYFFQHHIGGEDVPIIRSVNLFSKSRLRGEFDAMAIRNNNEKPELHFVEAKAANVDPDKLEWSNIIRKKLSYQFPIIERFRSLGYSVYYHIILTGNDEEKIMKTLNIVREEVSTGRHAVQKRWPVILHGVSVDKKVRPLHVERI